MMFMLLLETHFSSGSFLCTRKEPRHIRISVLSMVEYIRLLKKLAMRLVFSRMITSGM